MEVTKEIKSNISVAEEHATRLKNAVDAMIITWKTDTDHQTTLKGNSKGHDVSQQEKECVNRLVEAFQKDLDNIKSVATEFEALDLYIASDNDF